ncbi:MAG: hypothetical protein ACXWN4_00870 [Candidatus Limnocylindrales bacterium]
MNLGSPRRERSRDSRRALHLHGESFVGQCLADFLDKPVEHRGAAGSAVCLGPVLGIPSSGAVEQPAGTGEVPVDRHVAGDHDTPRDLGHARLDLVGAPLGGSHR